MLSTIYNFISMVSAYFSFIFDSVHLSQFFNILCRNLCDFVLISIAIVKLNFSDNFEQLIFVVNSHNLNLGVLFFKNER